MMIMSMTKQKNRTYREWNGSGPQCIQADCVQNKVYSRHNEACLLRNYRILVIPKIARGKQRGENVVAVDSLRNAWMP